MLKLMLVCGKSQYGTTLCQLALKLSNCPSFTLMLALPQICSVARIFWLSQSEERKNSAKPKKWPSMIRNVSLVNGQTDRLALPYAQAHNWNIVSLLMSFRLFDDPYRCGSVS
jgi:hypothetical protein